MVRNHDLRPSLSLDAIHALKPAPPFVSVHEREDDVPVVLRVLPLLRHSAHAVGGALQLRARRGSEDDERLVRCVHDLLERVRVELDERRELVADELCEALVPEMLMCQQRRTHLLKASVEPPNASR